MELEFRAELDGVLVFIEELCEILGVDDEAPMALDISRALDISMILDNIVELDNSAPLDLSLELDATEELDNATSSFAAGAELSPQLLMNAAAIMHRPIKQCDLPIIAPIYLDDSLEFIS